mmetsp:Transcript_80076/g.138848  ORF Transcript_80076/g.138848 Transcript_80076/m.138848 type:complete len:115 (-) Transcript_80076:78-422(-)
MHMGFGGKASSPCASAFKPHSNPTSWKWAMKYGWTDAPPSLPPTLAETTPINGMKEQVLEVLCAVLTILLVVSLVTRKSANTQGPAASYKEHLLASANANGNEGYRNGRHGLTI